MKEVCSSAVTLSSMKKCFISKMFPETEAESKEVTVLTQVTLYCLVQGRLILLMRKIFYLGP